MYIFINLFEKKLPLKISQYYGILNSITLRLWTFLWMVHFSQDGNLSHEIGLKCHFIHHLVALFVIFCFLWNFELYLLGLGRFYGCSLEQDGNFSHEIGLKCHFFHFVGQMFASRFFQLLLYGRFPPFRPKRASCVFTENISI